MSWVTFTLQGQLVTTFQHGTGKTRQALQWHLLCLHLQILMRAFPTLSDSTQRINGARKAFLLQQHALGRTLQGPGCYSPLDSEGFIKRKRQIIYLTYIYITPPETAGCSTLSAHLLLSPKLQDFSATLPDQLPRVTKQ